jgi:hypothetical protein
MNHNARHVYEERKWGYDETEADVFITHWSPQFSEMMFLNRFEKLSTPWKQKES